MPDDMFKTIFICPQLETKGYRWYDFIKIHQSEIEDFLDSEQQVTLRKDPSVAPAEAILETDFSAIDMNLSKQLEEMNYQLRNCVDNRRAVLLRKKSE